MPMKHPGKSGPAAALLLSIGKRALDHRFVIQHASQIVQRRDDGRLHGVRVRLLRKDRPAGVGRRQHRISRRRRINVVAGV